MNSFNHYSLGSCGEWLFGAAAGIDLDPAQPAYKHIIIHPRPGGPLTWVKAHHDSIYGRIESAWSRENGALTMNVTVPPNTTATVYVPASNPSAVTEGGKLADRSEGVKFVRSENGSAVYEVGAGKYSFQAPL